MCFMLEREFQTILVALNVENVKHFTNCKKCTHTWLGRFLECSHENLYFYV
jgi:hypothetical protein